MYQAGRLELTIITFGESLLTVSCLWCILWILIINFNFLPIKLQVVLARARELSVTESAWNTDTLTCPREICCETKVRFFYEFDSLTWLRLWVLSHAWKLITANGVQFDRTKSQTKIVVFKRAKCKLEPVCCKKQQKSFWPVTGLQNREPLKDLNDSNLIYTVLQMFKQFGLFMM